MKHPVSAHSVNFVALLPQCSFSTLFLSALCTAGHICSRVVQPAHALCNSKQAGRCYERELIRDIWAVSHLKSSTPLPPSLPPSLPPYLPPSLPPSLPTSLPPSLLPSLFLCTACASSISLQPCLALMSSPPILLAPLLPSRHSGVPLYNLCSHHSRYASSLFVPLSSIPPLPSSQIYLAGTRYVTDTADLDSDSSVPDGESAAA